MKQIQLTKGYVALVDDADFEELSKSEWSAAVMPSGHVYARRAKQRPSGTWTSEFMHRVLMDAQPGQLVDHENGDGLDNQRRNLRFATATQNVANRHRATGKSGVRGVFLDVRKLARPWRAYINVKTKRNHLGWFATKDEAVSARKSAALSMHGEFAGDA